MTYYVTFVHVTSSTIRYYSKSRLSNFRAVIKPLHNFTYINTRIHTYVYTYIHTYIYTHIHTYVHTYIHTYIHTWKWRAWMLACHLFLMQNVPVKCTLYTSILYILCCYFFLSPRLTFDPSRCCNVLSLLSENRFIRPPSSLCVCVFPPYQILNVWTNLHGTWTNTHATIEELLDASFSLLSLLYYRKVGD
jgi:hypothetical protein